MSVTGRAEESELERLRVENAALREALQSQWEENHFEHCGRTWPHDPGQRCHWPLPAELQSLAPATITSAIESIALMLEAEALSYESSAPGYPASGVLYEAARLVRGWGDSKGSERNPS